jgi:diacylglycerol kinase (ATP)
MHNPGAGRQGTDDAEQLQHFLKEYGHEVRYQSIKEDGWKQALKKDADLIVVAAGDGTVARITRRMVGRGVPMALLPSGTANNIGRTLGLVEKPFEELVRGWENGRRQRLDVGVASGPWGERYFVEGLGCGIFADLLVGSKGNKKLKKRKDAVEDAMRRLRDVAERCKPLDVVARLDGKDISGRYLMLEVLNLRYVGPNLHLAHDSQPGDGQFDVVLVTEDERDRVLYYLDHWQENRERLAVLPSLRGKKLELEWAGIPLHIDDKLYPKPKAKPSEIAGLVEARLDGDTVEFLLPA